MRIGSINLTWVRVPLIEAFRISSGSVAEKDAIVVRVESDGFTGCGESSPMAGSFYSADTPESCWSELCEVIAPGVLDRDGDTRRVLGCRNRAAKSPAGVPAGVVSLG